MISDTRSSFLFDFIPLSPNPSATRTSASLANPPSRPQAARICSSAQRNRPTAPRASSHSSTKTITSIRAARSRTFQRLLFAERRSRYQTAGLLAFFLVSANGFIGLFWLGPFTVLLVVRVPREEAVMREKFGDTYRAYERRTGRFLPRLLA